MHKESIKFEMKNFLIIVTIIFISFHNLIGQAIPIVNSKIVDEYIQRRYNVIRDNYISFSQGYFTIDELLNLSEIPYETDMSFFNWFSSEYDISLLVPGYRSPIVSFGNLKNIFSINDQSLHHPRFLSYRDEQLTISMNWLEYYSIENHGSKHRSYFKDQVIIYGLYENVSFYSDFTMIRMQNTDFSYSFPEYSGEHIQDYQEKDWLIWDRSQMSIRYKWNWLNVELNKLPIILGPGRKTSPLLSGNTQPISHIYLSTKYKKLHFSHFHGSLISYGNESYKKIAGHRIELQITNNSILSFTELVIYNRPQFEIGYSLPLNLIWSEEHNLGNKDNMLMALDGVVQLTNSFKVYGTFLWDEMYWVKLFKDWWGNKYVIQTGIHWKPFREMNLPDFNIEYSLARPWTYTHNDTLITYTSAGADLGLPYGPNSQTLTIKSNIFLSSRSFFQFQYMHKVKGTEIGSNSTDNYDLRNKDLDDNTPMLLGDYVIYNKYKMIAQHSLSKMFQFNCIIEYNDQIDDLYFSGSFVIDL